MSADNKIELKSFESSAKLRELAAKSNENRDAFLDGDEVSVFRGYVNDAESKKQLTNDDKAFLKDIMGYTPIAKSMDSVGPDQVKAEEKPVDENALYQEVVSAFNKARGYNPRTNKYARTIDEAYKAVKHDEAFKDKKYKAALKQLKYDRKHSIADAEAQEVRRKASLAVDDRLNIVNEKALNLQDEGAVRDAQIEYIKKQNNGKIDKRVKKALRNKNQSMLKNIGLFVSGNYSAGKQDDISTAALNTAAGIANRHYNKEEAIDFAGSEEMLNNYMKIGLVKYDKENNDYDIKNLSLLFLNSIGADATINEHDVDVEAETQAFRNKLHFQARANGLDLQTKDITNKQILDLGTKLGYYDNHYHGKFVRTWQKATQGLAKGAIIGAAAGAQGHKTNIDISQHQEINIPMENFTEAEKTEFLSELQANNALYNEPVTVATADGITTTTFGKVSELATGIYLTQDQMLKGELSSLWKHIGLGAAIGGAVGAGFGIIEGLTSKGREKECFGLVADCDNIKTYEDMVAVIENAYPDENLKPEQKEALKKIAILGYKTEWVTDEKTGKQYERFVQVKDADGKCKPVWDWCTFLSNYNKYRGNQIFNANELRMASALTQNRTQNIKTEDCTPVEQDKKTPENTNPTQPKKDPDCKTCGLTFEDKPVEKEGFKHYFKYGYGDWTNIIKAYYDYDCIADEAKKAGYKKVTVYFKHEVCRNADGTYDEAKFKDLVDGKIPKFITLPDKIGGCELNRNGKVEFKQPVGAPKGYTGGISVKSRGTETEVTDCKGRKATGKNLDEAIKNLNKKLPSGSDPYTRSDVRKPQQKK